MKVVLATPQPNVSHALHGRRLPPWLCGCLWMQTAASLQPVLLRGFSPVMGSPRSKLGSMCCVRRGRMRKPKSVRQLAVPRLLRGLHPCKSAGRVLDAVPPRPRSAPLARSGRTMPAWVVTYLPSRHLPPIGLAGSAPCLFAFPPVPLCIPARCA